MKERTGKEENIDKVSNEEGGKSTEREREKVPMKRKLKHMLCKLVKERICEGKRVEMR